MVGTRFPWRVVKATLQCVLTSVDQVFGLPTEKQTSRIYSGNHFKLNPPPFSLAQARSLRPNR